MADSYVQTDGGVVVAKKVVKYIDVEIVKHIKRVLVPHTMMCMHHIWVVVLKSLIRFKIVILGIHWTMVVFSVRRNRSRWRNMLLLLLMFLGRFRP